MDEVFQVAMNQAVKLANAAGDKWIKEHTQPAFNVLDNGRVVGQLLDLCGFNYIRVSDKRTSFYKWCKKNNYASPSGASIEIPHQYRTRQEMGLGYACINAAISYLKTVGIQGLHHYSNLD